jgi:sulfide dehydrogenase cytochrome subunit
MTKSSTLAVLAMVSMIAAPLQAADEFTGRTIGSACFACHGAAGASKSSIPPIIIGVPAAYIVRQMQDFRDDKRYSTIMGRIARGYTDEEIVAVAEYISSQGGQ